MLNWVFYISSYLILKKIIIPYFLSNILLEYSSEDAQWDICRFSLKFLDPNYLIARLSKRPQKFWGIDEPYKATNQLVTLEPISICQQIGDLRENSRKKIEIFLSSH